MRDRNTATRSGICLVLATAVLGCGGPSTNDAGDAIAVTDTGPVGLDAVDVRDVTPALDALLDAPPGDVAAADAPADRDVSDGNTCTSGGAYPPGPYGPMMGQTIANLTWRGLTMPDGSATPSMGALETIHLQDLRSRGCRYAIVHLGTPG